jgi:solute carrier family 1 (neuronal/epithelial high affinity glutamate transporter), member 1
MKNHTRLITGLILLGLVLGLIVGQYLHDPAWTPALGIHAHQHANALAVFNFLGETIFMGLLTMLIIPLIATSVIVGITSVGDFRRLGQLGGWTIIYYLVTMLAAVVTGLIFVTAMRPGAKIAEHQVAQSKELISEGPISPEVFTAKATEGLTGVFEHLVELMIPNNIFQALAEGNTLSVIAFSIFLAVMITLVGNKARILVELSEALFDVLMRMVEFVLWLAPIGVFSLLSVSVAKIGLNVFTESIGMYMITVILGLLFHAFITLPLILFIFTRQNPYRFLYKMRRALMTAFATDSSSATLPVTIECATQQGGVSPRAAGLVLPLGSTVNMDGTALYEAVAVVFLFQAFHIELGFAQIVVIAITATLAAVGAAGIPSAGLVTMVIVVHATNNSLLALDPSSATIPITAIGLIIGVDRILDMIRTTVNVWGDAVGSKLITKLEIARR